MIKLNYTFNNCTDSGGAENKSSAGPLKLIIIYKHKLKL